MSVVHINNTQEFTNYVKGDKLCVVDFFATWCGPCKMIAPEFESLSYTYPNVNFLKVDVDVCKEIAAGCGIRAMPTFHIYKSSEQLFSVQGADMDSVREKIQQFGGNETEVYTKLFDLFTKIEQGNINLLNSIFKNIINHPTESKFQTIPTKSEKVKNLIQDTNCWWILEKASFKKLDDSIKLSSFDDLKLVFDDFSMHKSMSENPLIFDHDDDSSVFSNYSNYGIQIDGKMYPSVKHYLDADLMKVDKYIAVKTKFFHSKFCLDSLVRTGKRKIICQGDDELGPLLEKIRAEILS
eukprot:gene3569-6304_t